MFKNLGSHFGCPFDLKIAIGIVFPFFLNSSSTFGGKKPFHEVDGNNKILVWNNKAIYRIFMN